MKLVRASLLDVSVEHVHRVAWLLLPSHGQSAARKAHFLCGAPRRCFFQLASPVIRMFHAVHMYTL